MNIEILSEKENKPLGRKEIAFQINHAGGSTPSRVDIRSKIVAQFNADTSSVAISKLATHFGIGITKGSAHIYTDAEQMKRIELDHMIKRTEPKKKEGA
ncbi:MAG: 30S ribosomal protein S24e [Candidatus Thorarchaeota archaeon]|nr:30S ribosomal protein S24e [Candidatus Thorarchaeota archaeon]TFH07138.1 MAG: 30S ribosomal protein S24e [Candidatus Thorarchaeota archaeon]